MWPGHIRWGSNVPLVQSGILCCFIFIIISYHTPGQNKIPNYNNEKVKQQQICFLNLPTTTEEGGIPGVTLEMCGVRRVLGVLREVLFEVTRLGPGAGVLRELPEVCALLELLKEVQHIIN